MDREILYERINSRVDTMLQVGLVEEVRALLEAGFDPQLKSMQSLGYRHIIAHLDGRLVWEEAVCTLKRDHRRYAKRQLTWLRADPEIIWTEPRKIPDLYPTIEQFLS